MPREPHTSDSSPNLQSFGYDAAFNSLPDPAFVYNHSKRRVEMANTAALRIYGIAKEDLENYGPWTFEAPFDPDIVYAKIDRLKNNSASAYQAEHRSLSGTTFPVEVHATHHQFQGQDYFVAICRSTAETLESERRLKHAQSHYKAIFENAISLICIADLEQSRFIEVNPAFEKLLGYTADELTQTSFLDFIHPDDRKRTANNVLKMVERSSHSTSFLNRYRKKNGSYLWIEWSSQPIPGTKQSYSIGHDVTLERKAIAELERAKEAAEQANRAKSEFLSMMSHELRTPLNSIVGPAELLRLQNPDPAATPLLDIMLSSSTHLLELINSILDLSKIESGGFEIETEDIDIIPFLSHRLLPLKSSAERKGLEFELENQLPPNAILHSDPRVLLQILINIVGNAIKFTDAGQVTIRLSPDDDCISIRVSDTGSGIPESLQPHLFEPFRQGKESLSKSQRGSGLGLSISKKLVDALGGSIAIESAPNQGSHFTIALPKLSSPRSESPSNATIPMNDSTPAPVRPTVLLVEDEPNNQLVNAALLKFLKYDHDLVHTGEEAIELWQEKRHRIILMDIKLPGMSGVEACQRIKKMATDSPVFIIAQSAYALKEQQEQFLRDGLDHYISKPISIPSIEEALALATEKTKN